MFTPLLNPYFLFLLSSFLFQRCSNGHRAATLRREANTDCVPCSFGSQVSQSASWHARYFHCAPTSYLYFLLFLFSCSFLRHSLDHSNGIEWDKSTLFCFASFRTQRGEADWQSVFLRVCVFHCSHCFYSLSYLPCTIVFSLDSLTSIITMPVLLLIPVPQLVTATG